MQWLNSDEPPHFLAEASLAKHMVMLVTAEESSSTATAQLEHDWCPVGRQACSNRGLDAVQPRPGSYGGGT